MTLSGQNQKRSHDWMFLLYLIFFTSLFFSLRALSSISVAALLLSGLFLNKLETGRLINKKIINPFTMICLLFFIIQFAGLLYTHNSTQQWSSLRLKSSLLFIPLAVTCCDFINSKTRHKLLIGYCLLLFSATLYCVIAALVDYSLNQKAEVFFYYDLVRPLSQHAVLFSILVSISLLFLFESLNQGQIVLSKYIHILLLIFFTVFLFLLSSKLIIVFYLIYLFYFFVAFFRHKKNKKVITSVSVIVILSLTAALFVTKNPVSKRFNEIIKGDVNFIRQKRFAPGDYFNGLQFRLLQWRFVSEILTENKAWLAGVSSGDAQGKLNEKYISENMYVGEEWRHDRGFLGYNAHNQLLESLLQNGVIGAMLYLLIFLTLLKIAWKQKRSLGSFVILMLLLFSFSESVFESQYSLLIFTFFPLFFYNKEGTNNE
jgi:O-antigen ligase